MAQQRSVIRKRSQHTLSRKDIDEDCLKVMHRLNRQGHKAYLVGGGVRDILLGRKPKDYDVSTDAEPNEIKKLFRNCFLVGRRFRLAHIRFGYHKVIETSTFRRQPELKAAPDDPNASLLQKDDNQFGTPVEDARRRDFTINGLFYDLKDFSIIDHVGGLSDLKKGVIRSIGDPNMRFREDPVRMLRAVRFASRLGFRIEARTRKAILKHYKEIEKSSSARLLEEIYRLFAFHAGEAAFLLLWKTKLMSVLFPELSRYVDKYGKDNASLWRYLGALDSGEHWQGQAPPALMFAVLLWDSVQKRAEELGIRDDYAAFSTLIPDLIEPIARRCSMPKAVRFRLIRILVDQDRLAAVLAPPPPKRDKRRPRSSPQRMATQESFSEAMALLEIRAASGDVDPEVLVKWEGLVKEIRNEARKSGPADGDADNASEAIGDSRPRPRRRRRRKPSHESADT